jgi:hypothetical protein
MAFVVTVLPWMVQNTTSFGSPELSIQGGHMLFLRAFEADHLPIPTDTAEGRLAKRVYDETYEAGVNNS